MSSGAVRTVGGGAVIGGLVGLLAAGAPALLFLGAAGLAGLLLGRRPMLLLAVFLLVEETYVDTPYYIQAGPLLTTGHSLYQEIKGVTPALLLLSLGLVMLSRDDRQSRGRPGGRTPDGLRVVLLALLAWSATLSLAQERRDFATGSVVDIVSNTLAAVMPWLLMLLAYAVAVHAIRRPGGREALMRMLGGVLLIKGGLGLAVLATTGGTVIDGQRYLVYYDAALPMLAGMAIVGYLAASRADLPYRKLVLAAAAVIVVFSFRRSVWSAMALGIALLPLVRQRAAVVVRLACLAAVMLVGVALLPQSAKQSAFKRVGSAVSDARGTGNEDSAVNHQKDVEVGFRIAKDNPYTGIGVWAAQRREFASHDAGRLYVHNDLLQQWLRFGLPGIVLYLLLLGVLAARAFRVLTRTRDLSVVDAASAALGLLLVVPVMTAPFITDTARWPVVVALAAAALRVNLTAVAEPEPAHEAAAPDGRVPVLV
jgi:O-antigen ligase